MERPKLDTCYKCDFLKNGNQCYNLDFQGGTYAIVDPDKGCSVGMPKTTNPECEFTNLDLRLYDVIQLGPCSDECIKDYQAKFSVSLFRPLSKATDKRLADILDWIISNPLIENWCLEKGIIRVREVVKPEVFYSMGDCFKDTGTCYIYIIARIDSQRAILVNTKSGQRYASQVRVGSLQKITSEEFKQLTADTQAGFKKINVKIMEI